MDDAADHPPVILAARTGLVHREQWFDCFPGPIALPKSPCHHVTPNRYQSIESVLMRKFNQLIRS